MAPAGKIVRLRDRGGAGIARGGRRRRRGDGGRVRGGGSVKAGEGGEVTSAERGNPARSATGGGRRISAEYLQSRRTRRP